MPEGTLSCAECGASFHAVYVTRPPKTCSARCKAAWAARPGKSWPWSTCRRCGDQFQYKPNSLRKGVYCSRDCSMADQRRSVTASCEICNVEFVRKSSDFARRDGNKGGRFCSKPCQGVWVSQEAARKRAEAPPKSKPKPAPRSRVYFPTCVECGKTFCARGANAKRCSLQCKIDSKGARVKDLYALATKYNKLTRTYEGAEWRRALIQYLVDRDGDRCGICNRKVDIALKSGTKGSRKGPSIDHIIPRSRGGEDDLANYRLTHWGCNQSRGNRGGNEQLALVG